MQGLLTKKRRGIDPTAAPFAKSLAETEEMGLREGASLVEVVIIRSYWWSILEFLNAWWYPIYKKNPLTLKSLMFGIQHIVISPFNVYHPTFLTL